MTFRDLINESAGMESLYENAGNLKGLPSVFLKRLVWGQNRGGMGGQNSELILHKANAKQKDLTSLLKQVGGWVSYEDKGRSRQSRAEIEAAARKKDYAGVVLKVNGEWAYYAGLDDYYNTTHKMYNLTNVAGDKIKYPERKYSSRRGKSYTDYRENLTAGELGDEINFEDNTVDIYVVTADADRVLKRQERDAAKAGYADVSPTRKKAIKNFLIKKSGGLITSMTEDIDSVKNSITKKVERMVKDAIDGKTTDEVGIEDDIQKLRTKLKEVSKIGYYIAKIVDSGEIKQDWADFEGSKDTNAYKSFKKIINDFKNEEGID